MDFLSHLEALEKANEQLRSSITAHLGPGGIVTIDNKQRVSDWEKLFDLLTHSSPCVSVPALQVCLQLAIDKRLSTGFLIQTCLSYSAFKDDFFGLGLLANALDYLESEFAVAEGGPALLQLARRGRCRLSDLVKAAIYLPILKLTGLGCNGSITMRDQIRVENGFFAYCLTELSRTDVTLGLRLDIADALLQDCNDPHSLALDVYDLLSSALATVAEQQRSDSDTHAYMWKLIKRMICVPPSNLTLCRQFSQLISCVECLCLCLRFGSRVPKWAIDFFDRKLKEDKVTRRLLAANLLLSSGTLILSCWQQVCSTVWGLLVAAIDKTPRAWLVSHVYLPVISYLAYCGQFAPDTTRGASCPSPGQGDDARRLLDRLINALPTDPPPTDDLLNVADSVLNSSSSFTHSQQSTLRLICNLCKADFRSDAEDFLSQCEKFWYPELGAVNSSHPLGQLAHLSWLLLQPQSVRVYRFALSRLISNLRQSQQQSLALSVVLHQLSRHGQPAVLAVALDSLGDLGTLATMKAVERLAQSTPESCYPSLLRAAVRLWESDDRLFPYLESILSVQRRQVNHATQLAKHRAYVRLAEVQPSQRAVVYLEKAFKTAVDPTSPEDVAVMAVEFLRLMVLTGVLEFQSLLDRLLHTLEQQVQLNQRPRLLVSLCHLTGIAGIVRLETEAYQAFVADRVNWLWQLVARSPKRSVSCAALAALGNFRIADFHAGHVLLILSDSLPAEVLSSASPSRTSDGEKADNSNATTGAEADDLDDQHGQNPLPGYVWPKIASAFLETPVEQESALKFLSGLALKELDDLPHGMGPQGTSQGGRGGNSSLVRQLPMQVLALLNNANTEPDATFYLCDAHLRLCRAPTLTDLRLLVIESRRLAASTFEERHAMLGLVESWIEFAQRFVATMRLSDGTIGVDKIRQSFVETVMSAVTANTTSFPLALTGLSVALTSIDESEDNKAPSPSSSSGIVWSQELFHALSSAAFGLEPSGFQAKISPGFAAAAAAVWRRANADAALRCAALLCLPAAIAATDYSPSPSTSPSLSSASSLAARLLDLLASRPPNAATSVAASVALADHLRRCVRCQPIVEFLPLCQRFVDWAVALLPLGTGSVTGAAAAACMGLAKLGAALAVSGSAGLTRLFQLTGGRLLVQLGMVPGSSHPPELALAASAFLSIALVTGLELRTNSQQSSGLDAEALSILDADKLDGPARGVLVRALLASRDNRAAALGHLRSLYSRLLKSEPGSVAALAAALGSEYQWCQLPMPASAMRRAGVSEESYHGNLLEAFAQRGRDAWILGNLVNWYTVARQRHDAAQQWNRLSDSLDYLPPGSLLRALVASLVAKDSSQALRHLCLDCLIQCSNSSRSRVSLPPMDWGPIATRLVLLGNAERDPGLHNRLAELLVGLCRRQAQNPHQRQQHQAAVSLLQDLLQPPMLGSLSASAVCCIIESGLSDLYDQLDAACRSFLLRRLLPSLLSDGAFAARPQMARCLLAAYCRIVEAATSSAGLALELKQVLQARFTAGSCDTDVNEMLEKLCA